MKKGSPKKRDTAIVTVWVTDPMSKAIDDVVKRHDTDRSKYTRAALREKLERDGIKVSAA